MKTIKNIWMITGIITLSTMLFFFKNKTNQTIKNNNTTKEKLVMGIAAGYAPYVSINESGEYEGFDIDVAQALAKQLNKELIFKDLGSMTPLIMALEQGSVDALIWGLEITQARNNKFSMINYQGEKSTTYPLLFWKEIPANVKNLNDLSGKIICSEPSSSQYVVLNKYKNIIIKPTERIDDALIALQYKKADAAFVDPVIAKKFKKIFPEIQILEIPLNQEDQVDGCGIAVKKENIKMTTEIKRGIEILKQNNTIKCLEKKWGIA